MEACVVTNCLFCLAGRAGRAVGDEGRARARAPAAPPGRAAAPALHAAVLVVPDRRQPGPAHVSTHSLM